MKNNKLQELQERWREIEGELNEMHELTVWHTKQIGKDLQTANDKNLPDKIEAAFMTTNSIIMLNTKWLRNLPDFLEELRDIEKTNGRG